MYGGDRFLLIAGAISAVFGGSVLVVVLQALGVSAWAAVALVVAVLLGTHLEGSYRLHTREIEAKDRQLAHVVAERDGARRDLEIERRPKLGRANLEFGDPYIARETLVDHPGGHAITQSAQFLRVPVYNNPQPGYERRAATGVHARVRIIASDKKTPLLAPMGARWANGGPPEQTLNPNRHPLDLDTIVHFRHAAKCYVWNDQSIRTRDFNSMSERFAIEAMEFIVCIEVQTNEGDHLEGRFPVTRFDAGGLLLSLLDDLGKKETRA